MIPAGLESMNLAAVINITKYHPYLLIILSDIRLKKYLKNKKTRTIC